MGTRWFWRRESEKGPAKNQPCVSQEGSPEECLNLGAGVVGISWLGSGAGKEQRDCNNPERDGLTLTHVGAPEGG